MTDLSILLADSAFTRSCKCPFVEDLDGGVQGYTRSSGMVLEGVDIQCFR